MIINYPISKTIIPTRPPKIPPKKTSHLKTLSTAQSVQAMKGRHGFQASRGGRGVAERHRAAGIGKDGGRPVARQVAASVGVEDAGEERQGMVVEGQTHPWTHGFYRYLWIMVVDYGVESMDTHPNDG